MTRRETIRALKALKTDIRNEAIRAANRTVDKALAEARRKSSGGLTIAQMSTAAYGPHPYSVRHPKPQYWTDGTASTINRQSGEFYEGWFAAHAVKDGSQLAAAALVNESRHAEFMAGTDRMVRRPIDTYLVIFIEKTAESEFLGMKVRLEHYYG